MANTTRGIRTVDEILGDEVQFALKAGRSYITLSLSCVETITKQWKDKLQEVWELLKEEEERKQCLKTKCVVCPHCKNCDVDENGLLKEQQPRVVTLEEIHNRDVDCVWIEYDQNHYRTFVIQTGIFFGTTTGNTTIFACGCGKMEFYDETYNRDWRAWTARPTNEQRKSVPWSEV